MDKLTELIAKYGKTSYNGKTYVLTQQAYIDGVDTPYFTACAICPDEMPNDDGLCTEYMVEWYPTQEWLDSDRDDEGDVCNWDEADNVYNIGYGYNLGIDII